MATLAASAYFLTCCRPIFTSSFCYYIETPKFINLYNYPVERLIQNQFAKCTRHDKLSDHCLSSFTTCTDGRGWSLDKEQQRLHFLDIACGRIPQCGCDILKTHSKTKEPEEKEEFPTTKTSASEAPRLSKGSVTKEEEVHLETEETSHEPTDIIKNEGEGDEIKSVEEPEDKTLGSQYVEDLNDTLCKELSDTDLSAIKDCLGDEAEKPLEDEPNELSTPEHSPNTSTERTPDSFEYPYPEPYTPWTPNPRPPIPSSIDELVPNPNQSIPSYIDESITYPKPKRLSFASDDNTQVKTPNESAIVLTDDILEKLDHNLQNLESTFDKFVKKNRDFIQNLIECLNYEKQKQKALEKNYNNIKHENDVMKTKNEYLKMVNIKQLELFRDELDKGITENKTMYTKKIQHMELQMQTHQDQLHHYKKTEKKYLEVVENESAEMEKLKNEIKALKAKETSLLRNYVKILNFLEDVKDTLYSSGNKGALPLQKSPLTIKDSGTNPEVKEVLKIALTEGMQNLNVRDLSILHDAIQELNERLCHQNEFCGKNPTADLNMPHLSSMYSNQPDLSSHYGSRGNKDYDTSSNLSIYPSRQKPERSHVRFSL